MVNVPMLILDISLEVESDCVVGLRLYAFGLVHSFAVRLGFGPHWLATSSHGANGRFLWNYLEIKVCLVS